MTHFTRCIITILLFVGFRNYIKNIPLLLILLIITDSFDANLENSTAYYMTFEYQKYDKVVDSLTYSFILLLYRHLFDETTYILLWIALLYRSIGVYLFYHTQEIKYLHYYPDIFKEIMLLGFISEHFKFFKNYYPGFFILAVLIKVQFEKLLHSKKYIL